MMINTQRQLYKILELPKHLQTTTAALLKLGRATATETSKATGKARAVESAYLNQLVTMKIASKQRVGRRAVFALNLDALDWQSEKTVGGRG